MKVVLDTNVIVSGLLQPFSSFGGIVRMIASGELKLCYDARIISEYKDGLIRPKFYFDRADVEAILDRGQRFYSCCNAARQTFAGPK